MSSQYVIGVDEVGTGERAGPAYIGAVVVPRGWERPQGLRDSKKMSWTAKANMYALLIERVTAFRIISIPSTYIDAHGLPNAWAAGIAVAMRELTQLYPNYELIVDGNVLPPGWKGRAVVKADATVPAVSAASVMAKVNRDVYMRELHKQFPHYDWKDNVGYGTQRHWAGLTKHGPSVHHRFSYGPIKRLAAKFHMQEGFTK